MTTVLWFRRDLRLADHPALAAAAGEGPVLPVFVHDPDQRPVLGAVPNTRLEAALAAVSDATEGALVVRRGRPDDVLAQLAGQVQARRVHVTADLTPGGQRRDAAVAERLAGHGIELARSGTAYAVEPGTLRTRAGTPFQVFTPFLRAWRDRAVPPPLPLPAVRWLHGPPGDALSRPDGPAAGLGEAAGDGPAAGVGGAASLGGVTGVGEAAARQRWRRFLDSDLARYADERDRPDLDTTSRMSAHLAWGEIHPRTLLADLRAHPDGSRAGPARFLGELCWREFCADVLWEHPASAWSDLRPGVAGLRDERQAADDVAAWRSGQTGFPFVDAGMRQLAAQGWMHNRVRMVTASFLVKDLHLPWQVGARHFLEQLVDGDLASNNGNWQWVAGTGTDPAPYERVFNPVRQGLRFDPDGEYVRRWVPELAHLPGAAAHEPWRHGSGYRLGYPERIVDHDEERRVALALSGLGRGR